MDIKHFMNPCSAKGRIFHHFMLSFCLCSGLHRVAWDAWPEGKNNSSMTNWLFDWFDLIILLQISLLSQGEQGPKGEPGVSGKRGPTGRPGKRGKQVRQRQRTRQTCAICQAKVWIMHLPGLVCKTHDGIRFFTHFKQILTAPTHASPHLIDLERKQKSNKWSWELHLLSG